MQRARILTLPCMVLRGPPAQVTDCRALKPDQMDGRWLYGGGGGAHVSLQQLPALLAAAMTPEDLRDRDPTAARRMRAAQGALLEALVGAPQAAAGCGAGGSEGGVFYSVLMRWGMLAEVRRGALLGAHAGRPRSYTPN